MIALIVAISQNNCIGKNGDLPWHIPEDLAHFKKVTSGKTVLMGRKTWESIPEKFRPLPHRTNIVVSRQTDVDLPDGVLLYSSLDTAIQQHKDEEDIFVIGGSEIYRQTIDRADKLYITHVHQEVDGDAFFPEIDMNTWKEVEREDYENFSFVTYRKSNKVQDTNKS